MPIPGFRMGLVAGSKECLEDVRLRLVRLDGTKTDGVEKRRGCFGWKGKRRAVDVGSWGVVDGRYSKVAAAVDAEGSSLTDVDEDDDSVLFVLLSKA